MIVSASRRTDIPSYYSEWFVNRIKEGFVYARNPMNIHQISKIALSTEVVDGIVFWTKNPLPIMDKLHILDRYMYYFQFTVNSYAQDIEPNVPNKNDIIIPAFRDLSKNLGADRARRVFHKLLHAFLCMECDCGRNAQRIDDGQNGESGWFSDAVFWLAAGGCLML